MGLYFDSLILVDIHTISNRVSLNTTIADASG